MRIDSGRLNGRVKLLRPEPGLTDAGSPVTNYHLFRERWCRRLRWAAAAAELEPQRQAVADVRLLLRLDADTAQITTEWRLEFQGALLSVNGVDNEPADGSQVLTCTAVQE